MSKNSFERGKISSDFSPSFHLLIFLIYIIYLYIILTEINPVTTIFVHSVCRYRTSIYYEKLPKNKGTYKRKKWLLITRTLKIYLLIIIIHINILVAILNLRRPTFLRFKKQLRCHIVFSFSKVNN